MSPRTYRGYILIGEAPLVDIYLGDEAGVIDSRGSISDAKAAIDQLFFLAETPPRVGAAKPVHRPREDHHTNTVEDAARFEQQRGRDEWIDDRPTRAELEED